MKSQISIENVSKVFGRHKALKNVFLEIKEGEIFALLGPNGAGKTTLISAICGLCRQTSGNIKVNNFDTLTHYKETRNQIGLVPQELPLDGFESVYNSCQFSRGLFGLKDSRDHIEKILKTLSLFDKRDEQIFGLSGGMKRRLLIAKALAHEPKILFLDEPTAGVDINLRRDMWRAVRELKEKGVTIILTTHYIEEAEAISDRVSVINNGEIIITDNKNDLMQKMGQKNLTIEFQEPFNEIPSSLGTYNLKMNNNISLTYTYDSQGSSTGITALLQDIKSAGLKLKDLNSSQTSLETIFEKLLEESA